MHATGATSAARASPCRGAWPCAPTGLSLSDPGVQLLDADGDGRCELVVSGGRTAGDFRLRFGPAWGRFHRYERAPVFAFKDARMRLVDLDGDGVTDIVQAGDRPQCYFAVPGDGWRGPQPLRALADGLPALDEHDPRLRWADMTGDGLTDIVLVHARGVEYWPSLGHGRFGRKVRMRAGPDLPNRYLPERLLLADVDGDGLADLVYVDDHRVTVWFNRCGDAWSEPVQVAGVPGAGGTCGRRTCSAPARRASCGAATRRPKAARPCTSSTSPAGSSRACSSRSTTSSGR